jgi:PPOX class probable F420-dependent enzyme
MDISEALDFVRTHHRGILATMRRDGTPQMSPISAGVDDAGRVVISTREPAMKTRNLRRDPRAWVCLFTEAWFGPWVQINGDVEIVSQPEALPLLEDYYRQVAGEHPDWDEYRAAMIAERRCLIRITPTSAGPTVSG